MTARDSAPAPAAPTAGTLARTAKRALREPGVLLSLAYLAASALGLWASYWMYRPFGIPILEYMQPSDVLVAGLRDPTYVALVALSFAFWQLVRMWERWRFENPERVERLRRRWYGRLWAPLWRERLRRSAIGQALFGIGFATYLTLWFVYWYAQTETERMLQGRGTAVELTYASADAPSAEPALLIGTTANWVFVYWPQQHRAEAIAQQSLRSLRYPVAAPRPVR
ncbi:MAG TPA: hypothetical protein VGC30_03630 [Dokdonella sp.]